MKIEVSEIHIDIQGHLRKVQSDTLGTFAASEWHRLYMPYVPFRTGTLAQQVVIHPWMIEHTAPYAHYQYTGEVYGPNYPIYENGALVGWFSRRGLPKQATGRSLSFRKDLHPLASREWDKAAEPTQKHKLISAMQHFVDSGRLNFGG